MRSILVNQSFLDFQPRKLSLKWRLFRDSYSLLEHAFAGQMAKLFRLPWLYSNLLSCWLVCFHNRNVWGLKFSTSPAPRYLLGGAKNSESGEESSKPEYERLWLFQLEERLSLIVLVVDGGLCCSAEVGTFGGGMICSLGESVFVNSCWLLSANMFWSLGRQPRIARAIFDLEKIRPLQGPVAYHFLIPFQFPCEFFNELLNSFFYYLVATARSTVVGMQF